MAPVGPTATYILAHLGPFGNSQLIGFPLPTSQTPGPQPVTGASHDPGPGCLSELVSHKYPLPLSAFQPAQAIIRSAFWVAHVPCSSDPVRAGTPPSPPQHPLSSRVWLRLPSLGGCPVCRSEESSVLGVSTALWAQWASSLFLPCVLVGSTRFWLPLDWKLPEGRMVSQQSLGATRTAPLSGVMVLWGRCLRAEMRRGWLGVQLPGPPPSPGPGSCLVAGPPPVTVTPSCVCFHCRPRAPTAANSLAETHISCHFLLTLE